MDLFQHEVGVAALLSGFFVPIGGQHFPLHRLAEGVVEPDAVGLDHRHVALLEDAVAAGVLEQGRNIGGHEVLALAPAHDEGALLLDSVDGVRLFPEQHAQRIAAPHHRQRLPQGCQRALLGLGAAEVVDELDQHFGVRLALKGDALGHDAHARGGVGMAVDVAGLAVGGPAGVSDAAEALGQVFCLQLAAEHFQPPLALDDVDAAFQRQRDAGGVIAAVFQLFQTVQQHFLGAALTRITYDATHTKHLHADSTARTHTAAVSLLQSVYVLVWLSLKGFCCGIAAVFCPSETFDDPSPRHPHGCHPRGPALFRQLKSFIPSFCSFRRLPENKNSSFRSCQKPTEKVSGIVSQSPTSVNGRSTFCGASVARPLYRASAYCGAPGHRAGRLHCPWPASPARRPSP